MWSAFWEKQKEIQVYELIFICMCNPGFFVYSTFYLFFAISFSCEIVQCSTTLMIMLGFFIQNKIQMSEVVCTFGPKGDLVEESASSTYLTLVLICS
jgi:hypothetical protein